MSKINVNTWEPESGTAATLMATGDTVTVPSGAEIDIASGATLDVNGTIDITGATATGFPSAGFNSVQTFTASGTWTRPTDITKVIVEVQGAGGGGAKVSSVSTSTGGGGGGYAKKFVDVSSVTASVITIGSGGAGIDVGAGDASGNNGGASTWVDTASGGSLTLTGGGGTGGSAGPYSVGAGGSGTNGDINITGKAGHAEDQGEGGNSMMGFGGHNRWTGRNTSAVAAGYGGGGGGAYNATSAPGTGGIIVVWEYK
jgi:hypothetical protein